MTVEQTLLAILARLDAIDAKLGQRTVANRIENAQAVEALIECIAANVGAYSFACADLLERLPRDADAELRAAMVRAVGAASPRRVGQLLRRYEGQTICGYTITREGSTRTGLLWTLVPA